MPTTFAIKALAQGQFVGSKGTLYTVPSGTTTTVRSIVAVNTSLSAMVKVNVYLQRDGTNSRRIWSTDLEFAARFRLEDDTVYTLEAGDLIEADADLASTIDYNISGWEETA